MKRSGPGSKRKATEPSLTVSGPRVPCLTAAFCPPRVSRGEKERKATGGGALRAPSVAAGHSREGEAGESEGAAGPVTRGSSLLPTRTLWAWGGPAGEEVGAGVGGWEGSAREGLAREGSAAPKV